MSPGIPYWRRERKEMNWIALIIVLQGALLLAFIAHQIYCDGREGKQGPLGFYLLIGIAGVFGVVVGFLIFAGSIK
ncbi:MAG TPA: hypothetical protein VNA13_04980 [Xanthomonadales bacterium]|nr:hypothetical protein [Xanthomonadales bacterium]